MRHNSVLCELSVAIDPSCRAHVQDNVTFELHRPCKDRSLSAHFPPPSVAWL